MRVVGKLAFSERRACRLLRQGRSTQRHVPRFSAEEERLVSRIIDQATQFGRYGYRRITALLVREGWRVNHKRVERIWNKEGLKVPKRQPKRKRLWLNDGSCIRLRPERKDHVWSYDLMSARTHDGRAFRILDIMDEYTRECLDITVERSITAQAVIHKLADLFIARGVPEQVLRLEEALREGQFAQRMVSKGHVA